MKLVTWNTQWCCGLDGVVSPRRIVDGARALLDFDVLCLQEIAQGNETLEGAPGDQPAELSALLPGFTLHFGAAVDEYTADGRARRFGNLIATRLPVLLVEHHRLPWPADPAVTSMPRMCTVVTVRDPALGPVRVMTTHLEYYSARQRTAQALALQAIHAEACERAAAPPKAGEESLPFRAKPQTAQAILCGDFNAEASDAAYAAIAADGSKSGDPASTAFKMHDAWRLLHGADPHPPTFRLFDRRYGPEPISCDFVFVSESLAARIRSIVVDTSTRVSDHQPVAVEIR